MRDPGPARSSTARPPRPATSASTPRAAPARRILEVYSVRPAVCSGGGKARLSHFVEEPRPCDYLPGARASLEYRVMTRVGVDELDGLLERGWRRLGPFYFRPACAGCFECVPLRIPVASFVP